MSNKNHWMEVAAVLGEMYVDEFGEVYIECPLCDSIISDVIKHLEVNHRDNPIAKRILEEIEKVIKEYE